MNFEPNNGPVETPLATSAEKTLQRNPIDAAPDTTDVWKAIRGGKSMPKSALLSGRVVAVSDQTIDTFAFLIEQEMADEVLMAKLRDLNTRMVEIHNRMADFAPGKVHEFLCKKRDEIHAQVVAGKAPGESPSRENVQQNFAIRRQGLLNQLVSLTHTEAVPLCRPILDKFASALEASARDMEIETKECCKAYGLAYEPAYLWRAAATVAARTSLRLPAPTAWATPAMLLEHLVNL